MVAINERDIAGLGLPKLPRDWPRSIHADLIERLVELGASTIVFDMDFQRPRTANTMRCLPAPWRTRNGWCCSNG